MPEQPATDEGTTDEGTPRHRQALGTFLRSQRKLANLSLRELAALSQLSNAYLSQIERGLHEPSVRVLQSISSALGLSVSSVLAEAGIGDRNTPETVNAIASDPLLPPHQKEALITVYRSYVAKAAPKE